MLDTGILWDMHGLTIYSGLFDYLKTHISASCTYVELKWTKRVSAHICKASLLKKQKVDYVHRSFM